MPKAKKNPTKDYIRICSFAYFIRQALSAVENMPPELRQALGQVIGDSDLAQIKDLAALEKALKKMSFS